MAHPLKKTVPALRLLRRSHGFTLVELMVALVLSATLVSALYQFFSRTSESMYEADSMAGTTDQARFALELLSRDVQSAGAFASPDSATDPWMNTTQARLRNIRVRGFMKPKTQQDIVLGGSIQSKVTNQHNGAQVISTDSLILIGAFDFPLSFQIDNVQNVGADGMTVRIPMHGRGVMRLLTPDPFNTTIPNRAGFTIPAAFQSYLAGDGVDRWKGRMLRVVDRQGYFQFATLNARPQFDDNSGVTLALGGSSGAYLMARQNNELMGLAPSTNDGTADVGYDASFIDVIRYRLCVDPADPSNLRLVRERLDANSPELLKDNPAVPMPDQCGAGGNIIEQVPVLDHAVDFQVWFDCNQSANITGANSQNIWDNYAGSWLRVDAAAEGSAQHNCTFTGVNALQAGESARARIAHLRVSVRTDSERRDVGNYMFLDDGSNTRIGSLQTVDLDDDAATNARVVTFQTDIELPNANYRTPRAPIAAP